MGTFVPGHQQFGHQVMPTWVLAQKLSTQDPAELKKKLTNSFEILSNQQRDLALATASGQNDYEEYSYDEYLNPDDIKEYLEEPEYEVQVEEEKNETVSQFLSKFKKPEQTESFQSPEQMVKENQILKEQEKKENEDKRRQSIVELEQNTSLPPEVEVSTGEESERLVFVSRCELFRLANGEWKERGIGKMKVLVGKSTGKTRLLMRREQVLKPCCNHMIAAEFQHIVNSIAKGDSPPDVSLVDNTEDQVAKPPQEGTVEATKEKEVAKKNEEAAPEVNKPAPAVQKAEDPVAVKVEEQPSFLKQPTLKFGEKKDKPSIFGEKKDKPSIFGGIASAMKSSITTGSDSSLAKNPFSFNFAPKKAEEPIPVEAAKEKSEELIGEEGPAIELKENLPDIVQV